VLEMAWLTNCCFASSSGRICRVARAEFGQNTGLGSENGAWRYWPEGKREVRRKRCLMTTLAEFRRVFA
jgi:hypothetical protein